jgi:hypothetical protein
MTTRRLIGFVATVAAIVAVMHVVWSSTVAFALEKAYPHRVADLRRWTGRDQGATAQRELLARFIDVKVREARRPVVAFLGSSFTFGYPWQERVIVSRRYADLRPDQSVINASVTGGDLSLVNNWAICGAQRQNVLVHAAIVEIPVINTVAALQRQAEAQGRIENIGALEPCRREPAGGGYLPFVLRQPLGLGWVRFVWDVEAYEKPDHPIVIIKVPAGYFVTDSRFHTIEAAYRRQIEQTLTNAKSIAKRVYVFASPVFVPGISEVEEDAAAVERQLAVTLDACRAVASVECLDASPFFTQRDAYYNMTHLNQRGHQLVAEWLASQVN